jgi:hypothetical protein
VFVEINGDLKDALFKVDALAFNLHQIYLTCLK